MYLLGKWKNKYFLGFLRRGDISVIFIEKYTSEDMLHFNSLTF